MVTKFKQILAGGGLLIDWLLTDQLHNYRRRQSSYEASHYRKSPAARDHSVFPGSLQTSGKHSHNRLQDLQRYPPNRSDKCLAEDRPAFQEETV